MKQPRLADQALTLLAEGRVDEATDREEIALLLETALIESPAAVAEAARLFEYLDLSRHPIRKIGNLFSLLFTSRSHLEQLYGETGQRSIFWNYLRRPIDLMGRFTWASLSPGNLRRVRRLRKISCL